MSKTLSDRIAEIRELADMTNARMEGEGDGSTGADQTGNNNPPGNQGGDGDYPAGLGDEGKRAIDRMKNERNQSRTDHAALKAEFEAYKAANPAKQNDDQSGRNGGQDNQAQNVQQTDPDQIRDAVTKQITDQNNARVLRSDVKRLATGKLSDANDALLYLDLSDLSPNAHGEYDEAAITSKLDQLLQSKPYLAKNEVKFQGGADSGSRGDTATGQKPQLTRDDLKKMTPLDIDAARKAGQLDTILSGKN